MTAQKLILYADDDDDDIFLMQLAFKQAGIQDRLETVRDGIQTVEYLAGSGPYSAREKYPLPSLLLLDLKMPRKSGHEVLKWIRSHAPICTLPVIVLTSSNQESDIYRAYILGANGYLIKPGKPDELLAMVNGIKDYWLTQNRLPASFVNLSGSTEIP